MKERGQDSSENRSILIAAIVAAVLIILLWTGNYLYLKDLDSTERGTIGDMFGAINALFSGLALAGIILTILLQRQELKLQRQELRDTRKEFEIQNETLKTQRFDNTFFNMLNFHRQIVNSLEYTYIDPRDEFMKRAMPNFKAEIKRFNGQDVFSHTAVSLLKEAFPEKVDDFYSSEYTPLRSELGHYFRNLYRIVKMVNETEFSKSGNFEIQYEYTSIIRSQLSDDELVWLFYNGLSRYGRDKFKPLIEKYALLKNLDQDRITNSNHIDLYEDDAYGLPKDN